MSVEMQVDVYGIPELRQKLDRLDQNLQTRVDQTIDFELEAMQGTAQSLAPKRTGRLSNSILTRRLGEWSFQLLATVPYAAYVEFGTRYVAARRFLSRALELSMPGLVHNIDQVIREAVEEAGST